MLIGIGALALMLWEPHIEGRNAHATLFEIYFKDPFLAYAYIASIPFFVALYQAFKVLGYAGQNKVFSRGLGAKIFILFGNSDDRAGGILASLITFGSIVLAAAAATFERVCRNADIKPRTTF